MRIGVIVSDHIGLQTLDRVLDDLSKNPMLGLVIVRDHISKQRGRWHMFGHEVGIHIFDGATSGWRFDHIVMFAPNFRFRAVNPESRTRDYLDAWRMKLMPGGKFIWLEGL